MVYKNKKLDRDLTFLEPVPLYRELLNLNVRCPEYKGVKMPDKTLICKDCQQEFVFTEGEQEFYQEKGLVNEPQRCPECRKAKSQI